MVRKLEESLRSARNAVKLVHTLLRMYKKGRQFCMHFQLMQVLSQLSSKMIASARTNYFSIKERRIYKSLIAATRVLSWLPSKPSRKLPKCPCLLQYWLNTLCDRKRDLLRTVEAIYLKFRSLYAILKPVIKIIIFEYPRLSSSLQIRQIFELFLR